MKITVAFVCGMMAFPVLAGWNGAGVPGGTGGAAINEAGNWTGGVVDGDFSAITAEGTTALVLTNDIAFADGATKTLASTALSFASNATEIVFTSAAGIAVGQTVNGSGIQYNTIVVALSDTNGTLSRATTGLPSGNYTFARPAMNFDFGVLGMRASNVTVTVGSDVPGAPRVLTLAGRLCQSQHALPANQLVFSPDVAVSCTGGGTVTRESGAIVTNGVAPLVVVNGPVALGDAGTATTRLTLDGGDLSLNGVVSGTNARINVYGSWTAGTLTLTNAGNTFSGGLTTAGGGKVVADSSRALANSGAGSALGGGGNIGLNSTTYVLQGFSERQVSDRPWNVGGRLSTGCSLYSYGTAPIELTGLIRNDVALEDCPFYLYSSYQNRGTPNVISGFIRIGSRVLAIAAQRGTWRLTNPTNTFNGSLRTGGSDGATLQLTSLSDSGTPSAGGTGGLVYLESAGGSSLNVFEYIGAGDASCNREFRAMGNASDNSNNALAVQRARRAGADRQAVEQSECQLGRP